MRRASELPVSGPAATESLAASGGLERPGRSREGTSPDQQADEAEAERLTPPTLASVEREDKRREDEK